MRRLLMLQALFCQLFAAVALAQGTTLNVGTFNIRCPSSSDTGERDWNTRRASVVRTITDKQYDIIGLNECRGGAVISYMEQQLSPQYSFVKYSDGMNTGTIRENFNVVMFLTSKFTLLDSGVYYLATDLSRPTISWDNNTSNYRFTVWAKLKVKATDEIMYFFETHLDHQGDIARNEQARINLEQVRRLTGAYPVVLAGDHNSSKSRVPFYNLMTSYMKDARSAAKTTYGIEKGDGTMSKHQVDGQDYWDPDYHTSSRIDWIWVRGADVNTYSTFNDTYGRQQTPSDHFAIQANITLRDYNAVRTYCVASTDDISEAIAKAQAGDTIRVQAGRLALPGKGKDATVKVNKSLTIIGGYNSDFTTVVGRTELSGDLSGNDAYSNFALTGTNDNAKHLITVTQGNALELMNFNLHGGCAPQGGATAQGGAIYCAGTLLHISNCLVHDNQAYSNGAGVYCAGQLKIANCSFYNNVSLYGSGGGFYTPTTNTELYWRHSITNSAFYGNKATNGSAGYTGEFMQLMVRGCSFYNNKATSAGTYYASRAKFDGRVCFANNTFANNIMTGTTVAGLPSNTKGGSAIFLVLKGESSPVTLVNNTIVGNSAQCLADGSVPADFYGAAVQVNSDATVRLCQNIIAGNKSNAATGGDVYLATPSHVNSQRNVYSTAGSCNINFADNDLHMSTYSAALTALAKMLNGRAGADSFVAILTEEGGTPVVAVKSPSYGSMPINDVPLSSLREKSFMGDIDDDGDIVSTSILSNDQRGALRSFYDRAVRGAYEYGGVTGISSPAVQPAARPTDGRMYNLQGQQVGRGYKGIVVVNGKKVLMR